MVFWGKFFGIFLGFEVGFGVGLEGRRVESGAYRLLTPQHSQVPIIKPSHLLVQFLPHHFQRRPRKGGLSADSPKLGFKPCGENRIINLQAEALTSPNDPCR